MLLSFICDILEQIAPLLLAEEYDNVGLLAGDPKAHISAVACALEATPQTVAAAAKKGANLLVTHHPFIFKPIKSVDLSTAAGRVLETALSKDVAIYASHTNFDSAKGGMNDALASIFSLRDVRPAVEGKSGANFKLVVFVPETHIGCVSEALFAAGAGVIGNYRGCSFRVHGTGSFEPTKGAKPFTGKPGMVSEEPEARIEVMVPADALAGAVAAIKNAHPYEEPAYDIYPLAPMPADCGLGRTGLLPKPARLRDLAETTRKRLGTPRVRMVGKGGKKVDKAAVCSGSGAFLIPLLSEPDRTCLITGDVKYHDARLAEEIGLSVIDAGHFGTEKLFIKTMGALLAGRLAQASREKVRIVTLSMEMDPFMTV